MTSAPDGVLSADELVLFLSVLAGFAGIVRPFRRASGTVLHVGSYLCFFLTWLWCLLVVWRLWGAVPVVIGLLLGFVGVVPVALVIFLFTGHWGLTFSVVLMILESGALRLWWFGYARPDRARTNLTAATPEGTSPGAS